MSHTLLFTDDMLVKGRYYQIPQYDNTESDKPDSYGDAMEIDLVLRINGKLVNFTHSFALEKSAPPHNQWSLQNWQEWYIIARMLFAMGYIDDEVHLWTGKMREWIEICIADKE